LGVITYRLHCSEGHEFEGWFKDSAAFESQARTHALSCPVCGDEKIEKAIMAPAVQGSVTKAKGKSEPTPEQSAKLKQYVAGFRKFVEENAEYVGKQFPEEARKIHYGETEERHIYGESTIAEARELIEEGVQIAPMPPDPDDLN
jgi:hypothetical protein